MNNKEENPLEQFFSIVSKEFRHRKGLNLLGKQYDKVKLFGKTIYLDHEIPGVILDTFDNLGFITKDQRKPQIISKRKTEAGWQLMVNLPPGISFKQVKNKQNFFADATNSWVDVQWLNGCVFMDIKGAELPEIVEYAWNAENYAHMELPIPIGYSHTGFEVFDLCDAPHMLIAGQTGFGKTMAIHCIVNSLLEKAQICICDPKRIDFRYLEKHVLLAKDDSEIQNLLKAVNNESDRRLRLIEQADVSVTKIQELPNAPPYMIVVIDEMGEISKESMTLVNRIGRLSRAAGIHLITATQYPYVEVIPSTTRNLFEARLCFKVASETSSRVVLGEEGAMAAWLPVKRHNGDTLKGRAIWKFGHEVKEVQTMFLSQKARIEITKGSRKEGGFEVKPEKKLLPK